MLSTGCSSETPENSAEAKALKRLLKNRESASLSRERSKVRYNALAAGMEAMGKMLKDGSLNKAPGAEWPPEIEQGFSVLKNPAYVPVLRKEVGVGPSCDEPMASETNGGQLRALNAPTGDDLGTLRTSMYLPSEVPHPVTHSYHPFLDCEMLIFTSEMLGFEENTDKQLDIV